MATVKFMYYPTICSKDGYSICNIVKYYECSMYEYHDEGIDEVRPTTCAWRYYSDEMAILIKSVRTLHFDGYDAYGNFELQIDKQKYTRQNCQPVYLSVDGDVIFDYRDTDGRDENGTD